MTSAHGAALPPGTRQVRVSSAANLRFRQMLQLGQSSRERRKRQRSIIEGVKLAAAYLDSCAGSDVVPVDVFIADSGLNKPAVMNVVARCGADNVVVLSDALFRQASQLADSDGPILVIDTPRHELPKMLDEEFVYLDGVQDPGNIGTILRTCAAAGVGRIITSGRTAFCWAPKVLRAAMGAHFELAITERVEPSVLQGHLAMGFPLRALQAPAPGRAAINIYDADLTRQGGWIFGSEGLGVRNNLLSAQVQSLVIPQSAAVESLNVAAAVAVSLFEARRQRLQR